MVPSSRVNVYSSGPNIRTKPNGINTEPNRINTETPAPPANHPSNAEDLHRVHLGAARTEVEVLLQGHQRVGLAVGAPGDGAQPQEPFRVLTGLQGRVVSIAGLSRGRFAREDVG